MPQKKSKSQSRKNQYARYKSDNRYAKNKRAKLERHLKKFPDDEQAKAAIAKIDGPKRKTPNSEMWSSQKREVARLFKKAGINGHHALENDKISARIDEEHLRFNAEYKEELMKKEMKKKPVVAKQRKKKAD